MTRDLSDKLPASGDDRAVSPVVGVALLIAITVILAAVIGFVVLDTTVSTTEVPTTRIAFEGLDPTTITHEGGDAIPGDEIAIRVNNPDGDTIYTGNLGKDFDVETWDTGTTIEIDETKRGQTIYLLWQDPRSDREVQLGRATL